MTVFVWMNVAAVVYYLSKLVQRKEASLYNGEWLAYSLKLIWV